MAAQSALLSVEEYLRHEEVSEIRHEYIAGRVYAMSGGTIEHIRIVRNLAAALHPVLRGSHCEHFESEVKVWIEAWRCYFYPDSMIVCQPNVVDAKRGIIDNPLVIFEVLSESTERVDRGAKFAAYASLPSVREYVLIDSRRYRAEIYTRTGVADEWIERKLEGTEGVLELQCLGKEVALGDIYEGVVLAPNPFLDA